MNEQQQDELLLEAREKANEFQTRLKVHNQLVTAFNVLLTHDERIKNERRYNKNYDRELEKRKYQLQVQTILNEVFEDEEYYEDKDKEKYWEDKLSEQLVTSDRGGTDWVRQE